MKTIITASAGKLALDFVSLVSLAFLSEFCFAQAAITPGTGYVSVPTAHLEFDKPIMVTSLTQGSGIAGTISCTDTGSVLFLMDRSDPGTDANGHPLGHIELVSVTPKGELRQYAWSNLPNFRNVLAPTSYFAADGKVYALVHAEKIDANHPEQRQPSLPLVLVFGSNGDMERTIPVDPALDPITLGAYANGDLLLISEDTLNRRMRLTVMDSVDGAVRELRLFDNDAMEHNGAGAPSANGDVTYSPDLLAHFTEIHAFGDDLLLVPMNTWGMPIVEVNENGIVRAVRPALPQNAVVGWWIDSDGRTWKVRTGEVRGKPVKDASTGEVMGVAVTGSKEIVEINPNDGAVTRRIAIDPGGVLPACEHDGDYEFLTAQQKDGLLEMVRATAR